MNAILRCENLSKVFKDGKQSIEVLSNINFSLNSGESVAIVGHSGSGKSTLLHLLGGLDKASSGEVFWQDQSISQLSEGQRCQLRNRQLGFVYQFHHLLPEFNALENVAMPLLIANVNVRDAQERAKKILEQVGLAQRLTHRLGELSGGERQRVAIARALVNEPSCVLADEPTGNLDGKTAEQVFETLLELQHTLKTSFIIVTHDLQLAARMQQQYRLVHGQLSLLNA